MSNKDKAVLTDEEIDDLFKAVFYPPAPARIRRIARAIEAAVLASADKLEPKNGEDGYVCPAGKAQAAPASADNPSTAGAAPIEGLTRYGVGGDGELQEMVCGDAYLVADVAPEIAWRDATIVELSTKLSVAESRLAAPVAQSTAGAARVQQQSQSVDVGTLVNRFLAWQLPKSLASSAHRGIEKPIGTHLMNADEAKAMFEHCLRDQPRPTDDDLWDQTLRERDHNADMADKLAEAIGKHFGIEIGEHSNINCPWHTALDWIENATTVAEMRLAAPAAQAPAQAQWISVEDRLPEKYCLAAYLTRHGKFRIIRAMYVKQYEIEATGDECDSEYNEADDLEYIKAGWYECIDNWGDYSSCAVNEGTVTHWMPLPPAPEPSALGEKGGDGA